jgi:nicotinamide riboside kinase
MKITLTSTHSTGKTTLVKALAGLPEFKDYQIFTERTKYLKDNLNVKLNDDSQLVSQYIFAGERAKELHSGSNFISDRSIYDVAAYTLSAKSISKSDKTLMIKGFTPLMREYDYVFYIDPVGVKLEDNGLRSTNLEYREQINQNILTLLRTYPPKNLFYISGTTEERIEHIKETLFS